LFYAHDTEVALVAMAALVNTQRGLSHDGTDTLVDQAGLDAFLTTFQFSGVIEHSPHELAQVRALRPRLHAFWTADGDDEAVELVNGMLRETKARPYLARHDGWDWHLHVTEPDQPLAHRMGAEAAMAVSELIRTGDLSRLRTCAAPDCDAVLVDLSRNRSRRFCDTGNCANRLHVAAYRARRRAGG
jgi:predicted RNA-binding Zn ribbon-like protein